MSDIATTVQEKEPEMQAATPDVNQQLANSLWNNEPIKAAETVVQEAAQVVNTPVIEPPKEEREEYDLDEYFKKEFGVDAAAAKTEWETLRKLKENPPVPQEIKWVYDESKEEDIYKYINEKRQLEKLEKYDLSTVEQAAEIIKANLQFKHKELSPQQIDRLYQRQYSMPEQPRQLLDQSDEDYTTVVDAWKKQVSEKEQDMMIDATLAKSELPKYKSQIVLPDIPKPQINQVQQPGPTPEELAAMQAGRDSYLKALNGSYQNFKGFSVTAKDGDVQLPVEYTINPEELNASKQELENLNVDAFFESRWFDEKGDPNITLMQEDLYLLKNRDKIFQKIANEAAAQRFLHHQKVQNNVKLNGVNQEIAPSPLTTKTESQVLAETIWKL